MQTKDEVQVVRLGGIGYPDGDERSIVDGRKLISDLTYGRILEMEVVNERKGEV